MIARLLCWLFGHPKHRIVPGPFYDLCERCGKIWLTPRGRMRKLEAFYRGFHYEEKP